jgi:UDP-N-acetylmuramyl pentapeptide phosphotransferase/UDP-N-acetylglucosamine-1-phosphate transferase
MNNTIINLIGVLILSAIGVAFVLPKLIAYLKKAGALDIPNQRSAHKIPTPSMGGISFFIGLLLAVLFSESFEILIVSIFIALMGLVGLWDDLKGIAPKLKFAFQGVIATALFWCGFSIEPLLGFVVNVDLPVYLDWLLTVFFMLGVINAFNLIDGIDGLLIGFTLISSIVISIVFILQGQWAFLFLSMSFIGVSFSFLLYNFQPAKIFMGDTGSLLIGVYISVCILKIANFGRAEYSIISLSLVLFACVDMLRLFIGRYLVMKTPFIADRNHFHHILIRIGWSHKKIVLHAYALQIVLSILAIFLSSRASLLSSLLVLVFICFSYYGLLQFLIYRRDQVSWKKTLRNRDNKIGDNELLKSYLK